MFICNYVMRKWKLVLDLVVSNINDLCFLSNILWELWLKDTIVFRIVFWKEILER